MTRRRLLVTAAIGVAFGLVIGVISAATAGDPEPKVTPLTIAPAVPRSLP